MSMEESLLNRFDQLIGEQGYENRSEAVRDLVRTALVNHNWEDDEQIVAGSVLIFYDHHQRDLMQELTEIQHEMHDQILATTHFHIDRNNCLEIIVVKGKVKNIRYFSDQLISLKGVKYGKFTVSPLENM